jgi:hypothetical protein
MGNLLVVYSVLSSVESTCLERLVNGCLKAETVPGVFFVGITFPHSGM